MLEPITVENIGVIELLENRIRELRMKIVMLDVRYNKSHKHMHLQFLLNLNLDIYDYIRGIKPCRLKRQ